MALCCEKNNENFDPLKNKKKTKTSVALVLKPLFYEVSANF
jgi:hypothetical protein